MTEQEFNDLVEDVLTITEQYCQLTFDPEVRGLVIEEVYNEHRELINES